MCSSKAFKFYFTVSLPLALVGIFYHCERLSALKLRPEQVVQQTMPSVLRFLTALLAVGGLQSKAQAKLNMLVDVGYAHYLGVELPNGITQWLGMRFAAPPLGDLRFRAPADPVKEGGVLDAFTVIFSQSVVGIKTDACAAWLNLLCNWCSSQYFRTIRGLPFP